MPVTNYNRSRPSVVAERPRNGPVRCKCEWHRIQHAVELSGETSPTEAAYFVYWSTRCARCGATVEFKGLTDGVLCAPCEAAVEAGEPS